MKPNRFFYFTIVRILQTVIQEEEEEVLLWNKVIVLPCTLIVFSNLFLISLRFG